MLARRSPRHDAIFGHHEPVEAWDVEKHRDLAKWVESVNDGNRIVPTVLYSDGTHATNPAAAEVELKHGELTKK